MTTPLSVTALVSTQTEAELLAIGLELAAALELPVTSWRAGDPTRSLYQFLARVLASYEGVASNFAKSGFLDDAEGDWLKLLAYEMYGITKISATSATPSVTVRNDGGGVYVLASGDVTFKASVTGQTYHSTNGTTLNPGDTFTFTASADTAGSDGSVAADDVDTIVAPAMLGCVITGSTAAVGTDAESDPELRTRCRASVAAYAPAAPADAYEFVALRSDITGNTSVNRAKAYGSDDGTVAVYIATASGVADAAAIAAVQAAVLEWATPLTVRPTTYSAAVVSVSMTVTIRRRAGFSDALATIQSNLASVIGNLFAQTPIGNEDHNIADSVIIAAVHDAYPGQLLSVTTSTGDIGLSQNEVPYLTSLTVLEA